MSPMNVDATRKQTITNVFIEYFIARFTYVISCGNKRISQCNMQRTWKSRLKYLTLMGSFKLMSTINGILYGANNVLKPPVFQKISRPHRSIVSETRERIEKISFKLVISDYC